MPRRRKFSVKKFALFLIVLIIFVVVALLGLYKLQTAPVSSSTDSISVTVDKGSNYFTISEMLKEKKLIKSEFFYKIFVKLHKPDSLVVGTYELNQAMSVAEIIGTLSNKTNQKDTTVKLTFREGLNIRQMANIIEQKTGIKADEFINKVNDETYINSLINKYWFITDEVKNPEIYYDLEGYLFPDI